MFEGGRIGASQLAALICISAFALERTDLVVSTIASALFYLGRTKSMIDSRFESEQSNKLKVHRSITGERWSIETEYQL